MTNEQNLESFLDLLVDRLETKLVPLIVDQLVFKLTFDTPIGCNALSKNLIPEDDDSDDVSEEHQEESDPDVEEEDDKTYCRDCKQEIVWLFTSKDKSIPCDPKHGTLRDDLYSKKKHIAHFNTCPVKHKRQSRY